MRGKFAQRVGMISLCNASPFIFLSKIGRLHLLSDLFSETLALNVAWNEATRKPDDMTDSLNDMRTSGKITIFTVQNKAAVLTMIGRLHTGEVEVIIGAGEMGIHYVILDDGYARSKANQMGLSVTGTLGILIAGYQQGFLTDISSEINKLRDLGFRISDSIIEQITKSISSNCF